MNETSTNQIKAMRIVRLEASNIKRLTAVEIVPGPHAVIISGKNDSGKTSTIDAIEYALAGGDSICERPLRVGAKKGYVVCDLGEIIVERTFNAGGGTSLTVKSKDGLSMRSPQSVLDALCSKVAFDPLAFVRLKPGEQANMLKKLVGLDFTKQDADRKRAYDERTLINRDLERAKAQRGSITPTPGLPAEEVKVSDLIAELNKIKETNRAVDDKQETLKQAMIEVKEIHDDIFALHKEIEAIQLKIKAKEATIDQAKAYQQQVTDELAGMTKIDEAPIMERINSAEDTNRKIREINRYAQLDKQVKELQDQSEALTQKITDIETFKNDQVSKAKYPIEGLSFDEAGVMLNNLPFNQGSQARQLQAAIGIGMALNPTVKVILVRDASLLDDDSMAMVRDMAEKYDVQVWMEVVNSDDKAAIVIEDGHLRDESPSEQKLV